MTADQPSTNPGWGSFAAGVALGGGVMVGAAYIGYIYYAARERQASQPSTSGRPADSAFARPVRY